MTAPKSANKSARAEKSAKSANTRRKVDWQAVERDYRTGKFTLRELEDKHSADNSLIARKAKRDGWTQDLSKSIKQATDAKLVKALADSISPGASGSPQMDAAVVAVAAEINTQIILGHRRAAKRAMDAMERAQAVVLEHGGAITDIREAATFASAVESLSRTAKNVIEIERKAFNLDEAPPPDDDKDSAIVADLSDLRAKFQQVTAK